MSGTNRTKLIHIPNAAQFDYICALFTADKVPHKAHPEEDCIEPLPETNYHRECVQRARDYIAEFVREA